MKKKPAKKKPITQRNACDRMFSQIIRARGRCESCGATQTLQCSHIISRRYAWTRTEETNALCLCAKCHFEWHHNPVFAQRLIVKTIGIEAYEWLHGWANNNTGLKFDWTAERERLKAVLAEVAA